MIFKFLNLIGKSSLCLFHSSIKKSEETHRTAQPPTLAAFLPWGSSEGAGRMTLTGCKSKQYCAYIKIMD